MTIKGLITGITGQDGSYLAELLLDKRYEVHGIVRRSSLEPSNLQRIAHILSRVTLHEGDLLDQGSLMRIVQEVKPQEVYHLAAMSHVGTSFKEPIHTAEATGLGTLRMLDACRCLDPMPKFYFAGSSEMFGDVAEEPQSETTELRARSPYGAAKIFGYHSVKVYREAYGMHASTGILFNHESERRSLNFVTRKITYHVARQALGLTTEPLELGNLNSRRDWGHASDFVLGMHLMLQQPEPDEYVLATGETHTVREFVEAAYGFWGGCPVQLRWSGEGRSEVATMKKSLPIGDRGPVPVATFKEFPEGATLVQVNPKFYRPADVHTLTGNAAKAKRVLGWEPQTSFTELVRLMVASDMEALR